VSGRPRQLALLNPRQDERCRSAIQTTQLCNRLNYFALDKPDPSTGRKFVMSDGQIRAALGLLRKTLPDLSSTQLNSNDADGNPVVLHLLAARLVSDEIIQRQAELANLPTQPQTIDGTVSTNVLDAPLPTE
jgi:hypothetical protein